MPNQAVVMTSSSRVPVMNNHRIQLICMASLDYSLVLRPWQKRVLVQVIGCCVLLVSVDLLVGQLSIQIVLVKAEREGELHVVSKLALILVKALHLNHQDTGHYSKSTIG